MRARGRWPAVLDLTCRAPKRRGTARRNPIDRPVPEIGDELAASRALEDLALRFHDVASSDIVELTGPAEPGNRPL
ncbi:dsRBD fold-containing protein [Streptomyces longispororuber]|uniref:dsRBD fold-containing protein n=1 Tax=Streptomyces longispororuber TaxID=68230 RepID=UPI0035ABCEE2